MLFLCQYLYSMDMKMALVPQFYLRHLHITELSINDLPQPVQLSAVSIWSILIPSLLFHCILDHVLGGRRSLTLPIAPWLQCNDANPQESVPELYRLLPWYYCHLLLDKNFQKHLKDVSTHTDIAYLSISSVRICLQNTWL